MKKLRYISPTTEIIVTDGSSLMTSSIETIAVDPSQPGTGDVLAPGYDMDVVDDMDDIEFEDKEVFKFDNFKEV